ncbi:hypothetical protein ABZP36_033680 [Zizania latifolia]
MYIKAVTYKEYVFGDTQRDNFVMVGDGATKTIIMGNKSFMLNITTTMEAIDNGFLMRGVGVENAKNH